MGEFSLSKTSDWWFFDSDGVLLHKGYGLVDEVMSISIDVLRSSNTPIAQFFPPLLWLSEMVKRDPSGGVKIERKTFFRYFVEDIYYT